MWLELKLGVEKGKVEIPVQIIVTEAVTQKLITKPRSRRMFKSVKMPEDL